MLAKRIVSHDGPNLALITPSFRDSTQLRISNPDALRGMAIIFVVAIHSFGYLHLQIRDNDLLFYIWNIVSLSGVPIFFFADGWLYATINRDFKRERKLLSAVTRSSRRLLLPWLSFSTVYILFGLLEQHLHIAAGLSISGFTDLIATIWYSKEATQLYFLPALFIVRLIIFPAVLSLRGKPIAAVVLMTVSLVAWHVGKNTMGLLETDPFLAASWGLGFAALGWAVSEFECVRIPNVTWLISAGLLVVGGSLLPLPSFVGLYQIACVLFAWWLGRVLIGTRLHRYAARLGRHTMQIYLLHMPVIISPISRLLLAIKIAGLAALAIDVAATIVVSLVVAKCIRLSLPGWAVAGLGMNVSPDAPRPAERKTENRR